MGAQETYQDFDQEKQTAKEKIAEIQQEVYLMGANDFEPSAFNGILERLESGDTDPDSAIKEAKSILDNKMDYH
jgi:hypothetical protein